MATVKTMDLLSSMVTGVVGRLILTAVVLAMEEFSLNQGLVQIQRKESKMNCDVNP